MSCQRSPSIAQALYRVFILPAASSPTARRPIPSQSLPKPQPWTSTVRPFSLTPTYHAKTRAPEQRKLKWDNEITARKIYLVDPSTGRLDGVDPETGEGEPIIHTRWTTLNDIDTKTHRLVQVSPDEPDNYDFIPVCKIVSKKDDYVRSQARIKQAKEQKKANAMASDKAMKTVELNWAIDKNDLGHRLGKMKGFLEEGRRVEVVLASKKRGRKASKEECEEVLSMVWGVLGEVEGAKEKGEMQGKLGGFATLVFHGRPLAAPSVGGGKKNDEEE